MSKGIVGFEYHPKVVSLFLVKDAFEVYKAWSDMLWGKKHGHICFGEVNSTVRKRVWR